MVWELSGCLLVPPWGWEIGHSLLYSGSLLGAVVWAPKLGTRGDGWWREGLVLSLMDTAGRGDTDKYDANIRRSHELSTCRVPGRMLRALWVRGVSFKPLTCPWRWATGAQRESGCPGPEVWVTHTAEFLISTYGVSTGLGELLGVVQIKGVRKSQGKEGKPVGRTLEGEGLAALHVAHSAHSLKAVPTLPPPSGGSKSLSLCEPWSHTCGMGPW